MRSNRAGDANQISELKISVPSPILFWVNILGNTPRRRRIATIALPAGTSDVRAVEEGVAKLSIAPAQRASRLVVVNCRAMRNFALYGVWKRMVLRGQQGTKATGVLDAD